MLLSTARTYRKAYSGLSRSTWLLSVIMLINRSGTMVVPFMTLYLTSPKMGYSVGDAGIVFGVFGAGAFLGAWLGGWLTDRFGFYPVQLATLLGGGILFILLGQAKTFSLICTVTFLVSFVNEAFRPANSTAIAFYSKTENRTRSYALNRLAINLGWAFGSGLGGFLAHINYELLFWVDGLTNIAAAIVMWFFLKPTGYRPEKQTLSNPVPVRSAHRDKVYRTFVLTTVLFACCFFQLFTNMPVYFRKEFQFSEPFIGFLMALNGIIIALVEMVLVYTLEGKRKNTIYITTGVFIIGFAFLILNIPSMTHALALTMIVLVTFGEILAMPFMNSYWIGRTQPSNRGQYAALYTMAWSAAQTLGPMGGAQIAEQFGFMVLWWVIGAMAFLSGFAFWKLHRAE